MSTNFMEENLKNMYESYSKILEQLEEENQQLKKQLQESEKSNEYFADRIEKADKEIKEIYKKYNELVEEYNNIKEEVDNNFVDGQKYNQLKQQLEEKDNEIKQLKLDLGMFKSVNEFLNRYGIEKAREVLLQTEKTKNQDKISFCIEQLEKVKELLNTDFESIISWIDPYEDGECLTSMTYNHNNTIKIIDNQINELKGEE